MSPVGVPESSGFYRRYLNLIWTHLQQHQSRHSAHKHDVTADCSPCCFSLFVSATQYAIRTLRIAHSSRQGCRSPLYTRQTVAHLYQKPYQSRHKVQHPHRIWSRVKRHISSGACQCLFSRILALHVVTLFSNGPRHHPDQLGRK